MTIRRFEDLDVWRRAKDLAIELYQITGTGRFAEDFGLRNQIRRAAVSVMSNVAEGFGRYGRVEFGRFLVIARGSAAEVRSQLILAHELGYLGNEDFARLASLTEEVSRLLLGLHASLRRQDE